MSTPPPVSARLRAGQLKKSPIREIMKLADRRNIEAMGLDPDDVISFAGGWVNHPAPEALRDGYRRVAEDEKLFHELGAYAPTRGLPALRDALLAADRALYGTPDLTDDCLIVGQSSTQLTHTLFLTLLDPGDSVVLFDPSYANYGPQLDLGPEGVTVHGLPVVDRASWSFIPDPTATLSALEDLLERAGARLVLFSSPDNPTGQVISDDVFTELVAIASRHDCFVAVDFAYRAQVFGDVPAHFSASPAVHPNLIRLHSNSKWCRGLGRRLGWIEAAPSVIEALEVVQQSTALCGDTVHQYVLAEYLQSALADGTLETYLKAARDDYATAADRTVSCIREQLGFRCMDAQGGLYTVVDVETDGDEWVREVLANTGVIFVPGSGFGSTLTNAIRVSYGPLVHDLDRLEEGFRRVAEYLRR